MLWQFCLGEFGRGGLRHGRFWQLRQVVARHGGFWRGRLWQVLAVELWRVTARRVLAS
jgi:hypothetical protein